MLTQRFQLCGWSWEKNPDNLRPRPLPACPQIQQSVGNTSWILGQVLSCFCCPPCSWQNYWCQWHGHLCHWWGIYTSAALHGIYGGQHTSRCAISCHKQPCHLDDEIWCNFLCPATWAHQCTVCQFQNGSSWAESFNGWNIWRHTVMVFRKSRDTYRWENKGLAQFFDQYLEQVDSLLQLISACRSGDWKLLCTRKSHQVFLFSWSPELCRLMPVHLAQMNALAGDPSLRSTKVWRFCGCKIWSSLHSSFYWPDPWTEIKELKRHGGIVGLSQDDAAQIGLSLQHPSLLIL